MRPVLGFDTTAAHCAAALVSGDTVLAARHEPMATGQAERLMPLLQELLVEAGLTWANLGGIGVGTGPGNFTGIRIGVAAARGLALALQVPAVGVSRFEADAEGGPRPVVVAVAAPRGQVYWARPEAPEAAQLGELAQARATGLPLLSAEGEGALRPSLELGSAVARIAARRIAAGAPGPRPAPLYVRAPDAVPAPPAP